MDSKQTTTPNEVLAAVLFLRDEVRKGKLAMAPLLRRKLSEIGLLRERAFQRLVAEGRRAFLERTKPADRQFVAEIRSLPEIEVTNEGFKRKVADFLELIFQARSEREIYERIGILKAFLEEHGFMSEELLKNALGPALYEKYRNRETSEEFDESLEEAP